MWGRQKSDFSELFPETSNGAFCVSYSDTSLTFKFDFNTAILRFDRFEVTKNPVFHHSSRRRQMMRLVLVTLRAAQPANFSRIRWFRFWPISGQQKSVFSQLFPRTSNGAFCVSYAERGLTCKFEPNMAILDFDRFKASKNPIFHNSSRRAQMMRFVLLTLREAWPANLTSIRRLLNFERFEVTKNPILQNSLRGPQSVRFLLVILRAA